MFKKIIATSTTLCMILALTACSSDYDFVILPEYKGIEVATIEEVSVTDAEVEARIQSNLLAHQSYDEVTDRSVKTEDIVNLDISGTVNGEAYSNSNVVGYDIKIGADTLLEGFDLAIIGRNIGDEFHVNLTFPDNYHNKDVAGEDVIYEVKVNGIRVQSTPELNDKFVKEFSTGATTVEEYELEVRKQLENEQSTSSTNVIREEAWNQIMAQVEVEEFPQDLLNHEIELIEQQYINMAELSGMSLTDYVTLQLGLDADSFKENNQNMAQYNLKERATIFTIAEKENLMLTEDDYAKHYDDFLILYGFNSVSELIDAVGEETLKTSILTNNVKDFIASNIVQVEK